jgi:hypothetical protein
MIHELTMHPPRIEKMQGDRLFDLRTGHTSSIFKDKSSRTHSPVCAKPRPDTGFFIVVFVETLVNGGG